MGQKIYKYKKNSLFVMHYTLFFALLGIVTRDPPSFPRPRGHVRRALSRTRGYVGLHASGRSDPWGRGDQITVGGDNFVGSIEPYLTSFIHKFMVRNETLAICARATARARTKRTHQGGRRELSICRPIFDGASQFFCLPIFLITFFFFGEGYVMH